MTTDTRMGIDPAESVFQMHGTSMVGQLYSDAPDLREFGSGCS